MSRPVPPRTAEWVLERVLPDDITGQSIRGDLREEFADKVRVRPRYARLWYHLAVLQLALAWLRLRLSGRAGQGGLGAARRPGLLSGVVHDVRAGLRSLRSRPAVTAIAVLTLGVGIGATGTVFTAVSAMFLRPLPYHQADRLVTIWERYERPFNPTSSGKTTVNPASFFDWRNEARTLDGIAAFNGSSPIVSGIGDAERPLGALVTPNYFDVIGVPPALGRGFAPEHGEPGRNRVVIVSHGYWLRKLGADPGVIGRSITVDGEAHEIIGVLPPAYRHPDPNYLTQVDVLQPFTFGPGERTRREGRYLHTIGRLAAGSTADDAYRELHAIARRLALAFPATNDGVDAMVVPLRTEIYGATRPALFVFMGAAAFVLLITCVNVANLLLAQMMARRREFALRTALGAARARLGRQVTIEVFLLALAGSGLGLLLAGAGATLLRTLPGSYLPGASDVRLDLAVAGFTLGVCLVTTVLVGIGPMVHAGRVDVQGVLTEEGTNASASRRGRRVRNALVVAEVTLAVVLLVGAGLLLRSFSELVRVPPGFRTENVLTLEVTTTPSTYPERPQVAAYFQRARDEVVRVPGVRAAGVVSDMPFTSENRFERARADGQPIPETGVDQFEFRSVGPGYFETMDVDLLAGRTFTAADALDAPAVVVVNRALARRLWPEESAVGQSLLVGSEDSEDRFEVIGVVGDVLDDGFASQPEPRFYYTFHQRPQRRMSLVVRTFGAPGPLAGAVRDAVRRVDAGVPVSDVTSLDEHVGATLFAERFAIRIAGTFAVVGLLLAGFGIYGVVAYSMSERTREIGIRNALGARRADVLRLVMRQSMTLVVLGLGAGAVLAVSLKRFIESLLFGVGFLDPVALGGTAALLGLVGLLATWLPARRAVSVSPLEALRQGR